MNEADPLLVGLAGGAIGAVLAALFAQAGRAWTAWGEVTLHEEEAAERNAQLLVWVDDRTRALVSEMQAISEDHSKRNVLRSSGRPCFESSVSAPARIKRRPARRTQGTRPSHYLPSTKDELLRDVWGFRAPGRTRTIDSHACRLRRKLSEHGARAVVNVHGVGYRFSDGEPPRP